MIEVLKQALEALEKVKRRAVVMGSTGDYREGQLDALKEVSEDVKPAITSLRQAIAELESQEPVAWLLTGNAPLFDGEIIVHMSKPKWIPEWWRAEPLYTAPPQPAKPIPCANHCEATAFEIVIKNLQGEIERLKASQRTEQEQPLPPVEIGVDVTADGASVVAFYRKPNAVMEMFYSQFHPAPQRTEEKNT